MTAKTRLVGVQGYLATYYRRMGDGLLEEAAFFSDDPDAREKCLAGATAAYEMAVVHRFNPTITIATKAAG